MDAIMERATQVLLSANLIADLDDAGTHQWHGEKVINFAQQTATKKNLPDTCRVPFSFLSFNVRCFDTQSERIKTTFHFPTFKSLNHFRFFHDVCVCSTSKAKRTMLAKIDPSHEKRGKYATKKMEKMG
jgi:hypothetical protein